MKNYFKHKMRSKNPLVIAAMVVLVIIGITGLVALCGYVTMRLWNWLVPDLFGLGVITFWQSLGLLILFKILFGSFGSGGSDNKDKKHKYECENKKSKKDFSKWELYDQFWKEEGDVAFNSYVEKTKSEVDEKPISDE